MAMTNTLNSQKKDQVNLVDLFFYLLRYWYIFLLCILVACAYAYYRYEKTPFTYRSSAQVIIKKIGRALRTLRRRPTSRATAS